MVNIIPYIIEDRFGTARITVILSKRGQNSSYFLN